LAAPLAALARSRSSFPKLVRFVAISVSVQVINGRFHIPVGSQNP
jgi:hypothetical protein